MIKGDMRTRVKDAADITGSSRWSATYIDATIARVHTSGWRRILNANQTYRAASRAVTVSASGTVAFADLSSGSGNTAERFYRVLGVRVGDLVYGEAAPRDWLLANGTGNAPTQKYYFANQSLYLPDAPGQAAVVWVNHLPTAFNSIALDADTVIWPTDYEDCLIYDAAADLLAKGGSETAATADLKALAESWWLDMLADLGSLSVNPMQVGYSDTAAEWGG